MGEGAGVAFDVAAFGFDGEGFFDDGVVAEVHGGVQVAVFHRVGEGQAAPFDHFREQCVVALVLGVKRVAPAGEDLGGVVDRHGFAQRDDGRCEGCERLIVVGAVPRRLDGRDVLAGGPAGLPAVAHAVEVAHGSSDADCAVGVGRPGAAVVHQPRRGRRVPAVHSVAARVECAHPPGDLGVEHRPQPAQLDELVAKVAALDVVAREQADAFRQLDQPHNSRIRTLYELMFVIKRFFRHSRNACSRARRIRVNATACSSRVTYSRAHPRDRSTARSHSAYCASHGPRSLVGSNEAAARHAAAASAGDGQTPSAMPAK